MVPLLLPLIGLRFLIVFVVIGKLHQSRFDMPFHFCIDELLAIMILIPYVGIYFGKIHTWYHTKFGHKCHDHECHETHVIHPGLEEVNLEPEQDGEIPVHLTDEDVVDAFAGWQLTHKGFVAGIVFCNPVSETELLSFFNEEDAPRLKEAIQAGLSDGTLKLEGTKLVFGEL